ncbi:MAG: Tat pathway signal sequence domain protein [Candidatus Woesebacteria bacterium GW2011_GWB1_43_14]|uniref:Tat pathway signal sequence domain protein n=1 Tax=Candidatus Woesebacteria bacterium GW2011_GWB1_43_14 TaxID=1618578 RepID=A0A0G1DHG4_9BACT|nr:MAG: Tat pathway signal sequence domain protein [Candidatus Woesebacteria bacterium GW2011_GWA1_39_11b]KKS77516.1 MAG: coiled-coil [Candidatus Woesebacteria bacterium GW2011_GWC1_42_9]KKS97305.1 MAG: Tat pathway signal sequence domain protein [Candidatus Woesebacteria bacterium GW2011_GWB1_43_14]
MQKLTILLGIVLVILWVLSPSFPVSAQEGSELERLNSLIKEYEDKINSLQSQAGTLSNQIAEFDAKIQLTRLKIDQTREQILLLGGRIDQLEVSLTNLNDAFGTRAAETYKIARMGTPITLLTAPNIGKTVARFHYLKRIQEADRELLSRLQIAQETYEDQREDFVDLEQVLGVQKEELDGQKAAKANLLWATKSDEKKYQQLLSVAKAQLAAFRRFAASQGGATILENQTKCDSWGCYYNQRDSQWGNIGIGGSSYSVAEYGCLITSVSMLASHYGKSLKPSDIAVKSNYFVPDTGYLYHSAEGMPFTLTTASKSILDSELSAGRPVIAGLYSGPDHFIVILRKDGDNYIMHDPFMPDGANRPLTDKYSVSDISTLRLVSFN